MRTPIADVVRGYEREGTCRFHMPGHKGTGPIGCEPWDITEIQGADSLYEASGPIAESERNAARLFGSGATFYSTEGSSQCIRAMLFLALQNRPAGTPPVIVAARNVHKSYVYAAALLDFETVWLWPESAQTQSLCACPVTAKTLDETLSTMETPPAAVYVTSPDYLGNMQDIASLAAVCHAHKTLLLVDNAHGAYLRFLRPSLHPMDQGADACCDSAHKTLPVLTGGAYLHISKIAPPLLREQAKHALALFGSTSPSYLILTSLDLCNARLAEDYPARLAETIQRLNALKKSLTARGWTLTGQEPLKLTIDAAAWGWDGQELAELLRTGSVEPEYADRDYCVLMVSSENTPEDLQWAADSLDCAIQKPPIPHPALPLAKGERILSIREAIFSPNRATVHRTESLNKICGAPTVSCPPAVPIAISGERIGPEAAALFRYYGADRVEILQSE